MSDTPAAFRGLSTAEVAAALRVSPNTLRIGLCQRGEYMGLRPVKLPNRRLLWDADAVERMARGKVA